MKKTVAAAAGQALFIAVCLYLLLGGWHRDLRVPLKFSSDSLWFLMQSKSTVDNGWWWSNPRLGAPFSLDELAYPSNSNVDQAIVWAVSRFVQHPIKSVNIAWAIMVVLSGLSATWCLRKFGVSRASALAAGTLFALSPYALYRNIDHFSLVIYLVPFACAAALWLASGQAFDRWPRTAAAFVLGGCALLALDYVYYAFFACFCIGVGMLIGYAAHRDRRIILSGVICLAVICGGTLLNLAPSLASWSRHGQPIGVHQKVPAESEMFGLKIRQLISPVYPHAFPPFRDWVARETAARFPNEYENWTARLGFVGTLGFLGLLALLFVPDAAPSAERALLKSASRLTLAAVLLATVGGFGSLFSLLVNSDIRAYNRIYPFIAFFSLLAVAYAVDAVFKARWARTAAAIVILAVGIADQGQAVRSLNDNYSSIAADVSGLGAFVQRLERALPEHAMVFQLPLRTYMNETEFGRMREYDHFRPYLLSHTLRFSYPALSNDQLRWQLAASRLDASRLVSLLSTSGFSAILIDRYGYDDDGDAVTAALVAVAGRDRIIARTDRYVALSIDTLPAADAFASSPKFVPATLSMGTCDGQAVMIIDQIGAARAPFHTAVHLPQLRELKVLGWAVDHPHRSAAGGVDVVLDRALFPATYGLNRDDVAKYFKRPEYRESGFVASIPPETLTRGDHALSLRVVSKDGSCYYESASISLILD